MNHSLIRVYSFYSFLFFFIINMIQNSVVQNSVVQNSVVQNRFISLILSTSVITIPLFIFLFTKDYKLLFYLLLGVLIDTYILKNIFYDILPNDITKRPNKGYECGVFLSNTRNKGFPSGHAMLGTFIALYIYYNYYNYPQYKWMAFIYLFLITGSRYINGCHTPLQILFGMIFGSLLFFVYKHLDTHSELQIETIEF